VKRDRELERRLAALRAPEEGEAETRAWPVVREAYAERVPVRPAPRVRRLVLIAAGGAAALAIGLSPAGAKVGDLVSDVVGIGQEDAKPALRSLPAAGEMLVESQQGVWLVRADGSKRLLGNYDEATWSPHGLYVGATKGRELVALEPDGDVRWTITAPGRVHDPRWGGNRVDTRIAYRSDGDLWVVAGDGTGAHRIARDVAPVAPVWLTNVAAPHALAILDGHRRFQVVDADRGQLLERIAGRSRRTGLVSGWVTAPTGRDRARVDRHDGRSRVILRTGGRRVVLFSARGRLTGPTWSPDGRWLLIGWPAADQWLFIPVEHGKTVAIDGIRAQFDPGGTGAGAFPRPGAWILP
jgi:hypothetical protein